MAMATKLIKVVTYTGAPTHKVTQPFKHMIFISTFTEPMATNLDSMVTYLKEFQLKKLPDLLATWSLQIT